MKKIVAVILVFISLFSVIAQPASEEKESFKVIDQIGREVCIASKPDRIVSGYYISSSACIALGLSDNIVAIEAMGNKRPIYKLAKPDMINLPNVGTAKAFDLETCLKVQPELVILPVKQKDCANTLTEMGIPAIVVNPENHKQILDMFNLIGLATGKTKEADKLISYYKNKLDFVEQTVKKAKSTPVVYICGTGSYLTTAPKNMYQASLVNSAGGINAGDSINGSSWTEISYEQLVSMNPDIIIIPTNSKANGKPDFSAETICSDPQLRHLTAVKNNAIFQMPVGYEAWDSPVPSGILGQLWMLSTIHPSLYSSKEFEKDVKDFYKTFYGFEKQ